MNVIGILAAIVGLEINDRQNEKALASGERIPWWRRHLLLTLVLVFTLGPALLVFVYWLAVVGLGQIAHVWDGWLFTILVLAIPGFFIVRGYIKAERRWHRRTTNGTKVIEVRRGR